MNQQYFIIRGPLLEGDFFNKQYKIEKIWGRVQSSNELIIYFRDKLDTRVVASRKGLSLEIRKTVNYIYKTKSISTLQLPFHKVLDLFNFLKNLGHKKGIISNGVYYECGNENYKFIFRSSSRIGSFFEIYLKNPINSDLTVISNHLKEICRYLGLNIWTEDNFKSLVNSIHEKREFDFDDTKELLKEIEFFKKFNLNGELKESIYLKLCEKSNDYSHIESIYNSVTKQDLMQKDSHYLVKNSFKLSIIIPTFNSIKTLLITLNSISKSILDKSIRNKDKVEVIVVDDGSNDSTREDLKNFSSWYDLRVLFQNNMGRSQARNIGLGMSDGEVILFLDSDVIVDSHLINDHLVRHKYIEDAFFVSMKENINNILAKEILSQDIIKKPDISKDFRFSKTVKPDWVRMHRHVSSVEIREVKIMEESNYFKNFVTPEHFVKQNVLGGCKA